MSSQLGSTLREAEQADRTNALRQLLRRPLTLASDDPETFSAIVRNRHWLINWFSEQPGWMLVVDPQAGFARLYKVPADADASRPAQLSNRPPFDQRRYVLLCLALAALDDMPAQTTLARLAKLIEESSGDEQGIQQFDPNTYAERRALVDVLRWLSDTGVLRLRDGDADIYAQTREGDALYDVNDRLLNHLLACPVPPTLAATPERMSQELYPETEEGERLRAHHAVFRMLLDDPVVYYEDMAPREYEWLDHSRGFIYRSLEEDCGFRIERRKEGIAVIDPDGRVSDMLFPDGGSTVKHAALLLAEQLAALAKSGGDGISLADVTHRIANLMAEHAERCNWSKQYAPGNGGPRDLAADVLNLLAAFKLVTPMDGEWRIRPAMARFAPDPTETRQEDS